VTFFIQLAKVLALGMCSMMIMHIGDCIKRDPLAECGLRFSLLKCSSVCHMFVKELQVTVLSSSLQWGNSGTIRKCS